MAEYIEREALIENLNRFAPECYNALLNQLITKHPAADVVEVVRCKDCKLRGKDECPFHIYGMPPDEDVLKLLDDDFCSYGERKV